ncbi:hypothetical protein ACNF33_13960, partial [Staphylococcus aureus]|uniref:hypothetical protein n=1 Tax=Staphylococcus aureus TaxID=1280 RepID=UPI003A810F53
IVPFVNGIGIRCTLVDIGSKVNVFIIDLLPKIKMDPSSLSTSSLSLHGFDNVGKKYLCTIMLTLHLGIVTLPTLVHVI